MSSNEWAVIVWTVQAAVGVLFSGVMMISRYGNLKALERYEGNGDRDYRIFLAQQDIRRSLVRYVSFMMAFAVGLLFTLTAHTSWLDRPPVWLVRNWSWLLVLMLGLVTVNEVIDRWALHRVRKMYREYQVRYLGGGR